MRRLWLLLFFLIGCSMSGCPVGYVSAIVNETPVCISVASYCVRDDQCSSARFDCSRPCDYLPTNSMFGTLAREKASSCPQVACTQIPFVNHTCVDFQCRAEPHTADELIPLPVFLEVVPGKKACVDRLKNASIIRMYLFNNATSELIRLEAFVNVSVGKNTRMVTADAIDTPMGVREMRNVSMAVREGIPSQIYLAAVRDVVGPQGSFKIRNDKAIFFDLVDC